MARLEKDKFLTDVILEDEKLFNFLIFYLRKRLKNIFYKELLDLLMTERLAKLPKISFLLEHIYNLRLVTLKLYELINLNEVSTKVLEKLEVPITKRNLTVISNMLASDKKFYLSFRDKLKNMFIEFISKYGQIEFIPCYESQYLGAINIVFPKKQFFYKVYKLNLKKFEDVVEKVFSSEFTKLVFENLKQDKTPNLLEVYTSGIRPDLENTNNRKNLFNAFAKYFELGFWAFDALPFLFEYEQLEEFAELSEEGKQFLKDLENFAKKFAEDFPEMFAEHFSKNFKKEALEKLK